MRKMTLLKVFAVLVLCIMGIGFYRGWFVLSSDSSAGGNKVDVNLRVDPDKAKEDAKAVEAKVRGVGGSATDGASGSTTEGGVKSQDK